MNDAYKYFYDMLLRGYEVINVSYNKVLKQAELRRVLQIYKDFVNDHFDKKMIADYFKHGVKAQVFRDNRTGKILTDNDQLFFGFDDSQYRYTLRRQPLSMIRQYQQTREQQIAKMVMDELRKQEQEGKKY